MAYTKYKELTKYFNFNKELEISSLPTYVTDYVENDEKIIQAYKTSRDKGIFTDKKIILFDVMMFGTKQISVIPYCSISTINILFKYNSADLIFYSDSGYPIVLKFKDLIPEEKTRLRLLFCTMSQKIADKYKNNN